MSSLSFKSLFDGEKWRTNVDLSLDSEGVVTQVGPSGRPEDCKDHFIPGFINSHSHAFQYAMAGLTEFKHSMHSDDDFWSWRNTMYKLAASIDDVEFRNIASFLYRRMLFAGYNTVVEFHYLHRTDLKNDLRRCRLIIAAAQDAGINLVLVPIFYHFGSFAKPASTDQKMFTFEETNTFLRLIEELKSEIKPGQSTIGLGIHSLRAADKKQIESVLSNLSTNQAFHIHISEQIKEVEDCLKHFGKRPIEWLLSEFKGSPSMNLVHATHANQSELESIVQAGANIVICPSTEANLGDGIFDASAYLRLNGTWSIGSDSHILINPFEELRLLEYSQRLRDRKRIRLSDNSLNNSEYLFKSQLKGGIQSTGGHFNTKVIIGQKLNGLVIDENYSNIIQKHSEFMLSSLIFSAGSQAITRHYVMGKEKLVDYILEEQINELYSNTMKSIFKKLNLY